MHVSPHQCSERLAARLFHPLASKFSRLLPRMGLRRPFLFGHVFDPPFRERFARSTRGGCGKISSNQTNLSIIKRSRAWPSKIEKGKPWEQIGRASCRERV